MKKLILFGAGKIGRSFIGQLFSRGGYEVVFVDVDQTMVDLLNQRKAYPVIIRSDDREEQMEIRHVRALHNGETGRIHQELATANLIATAVGPDNLPPVIDLLGPGLAERFAGRGKTAVDIIIAENLRNASDFFSKNLSRYLSRGILREYIGLVETSIGKMVPIMTEKDMAGDPLLVYAEPYNTLILDANGFRATIPRVEGLAPKADMKAWVDRKSFIHNLGHAAAAYFGFLKLPEKQFLYELLDDQEVYDFTLKTMRQSARALLTAYPGSFTPESLDDHIHDLLFRFQNRALGDTVYRVGRDLPRKLGPEDRLCGAIRLAIRQDSEYTLILQALISGFYFRAGDDDGQLYERDQFFAKYLKDHGFMKTFVDFCKFEEEDWQRIRHKVLTLHESLSDRYKTLKN